MHLMFYLQNATPVVTGAHFVQGQQGYPKVVEVCVSVQALTGELFGAFL